MNGEYDPSTSFKEGEELIAKINGAVWFPMPGTGYFPMTEDYPRMKPFLMPVLDAIAARRKQVRSGDVAGPARFGLGARQGFQRTRYFSSVSRFSVTPSPGPSGTRIMPAPS